MTKRARHEGGTPPQQFIGEQHQEQKPHAEPADKPQVADVLHHDEAMAREVEKELRAAAPAVLKSDESPAASAEKLVEMAAAGMLKREVARDREETSEAKPADHAKTRHAAHAPAAAEQKKSAPAGIIDMLMHKAEERIEALPAPIKRLGHTVEKVATTAFWPLRFGLRLTMEVLRTPVALARILLRSREA